MREEPRVRETGSTTAAVGRSWPSEHHAVNRCLPSLDNVECRYYLSQFSQNRARIDRSAAWPVQEDREKIQVRKRTIPRRQRRFGILQPPFGVHIAARLLGKRRAGQHHVGSLRQ